MNLLENINRIYCGLSMSVFSRYPIGTNVFTRDWDMLILLDTCRVDALCELEDEYSFLSDIGSIWSVGSASPEWMAQTFTREHADEIRNTAYICGNGHSGYTLEQRQFPEDQRDAPAVTNWRTVDPDEFLILDHVWEYCNELKSGLSDPSDVSARAIMAARNHDPDRLIVHYNQPHAPHAARAIKEDRELTPEERDPFAAIRNGTPRSEIWEQYLDEIRFALDEVERLLENVDAPTTVISADHGDLFGKWLFSHPNGVLHPSLRKVPWAVTSSRDERTWEPDLEPPGSANKTAEERLSELGYL